jgi:squalene synthase HpnC
VSLPKTDAVRMARTHYENFPVLSLFLPAELRLPMARIYAFARATDDLGDEGCASREERLAALERWEGKLEAELANGGGPGAVDPVLAGVADTIRAHALPVEPFRALIRANRLDQLRSRYATFADLLEYCACSANPVGRIVLRLFGEHGPQLLPASDAVCSGLQVANHLQGLGEDLRLRDRLYVPLEDLERFGVRESDLRRSRPTRAVRRLLGYEIDRARALLESGAALPEAFRGGRRAALHLFLGGGRAILDELEARREDVLRERVRVPRTRALLLLVREGFLCPRR